MITPGEKSQFDVLADGVVIFSKASEGRFPEEAEILAALSGLYGSRRVAL